MSLTISDILHAAKLACVDITEVEAQNTLLSLNNTLKIIEPMKQFDVSNIEPMAHVQPIHLRLREDEVTEEDHRDYYQSLSAQTEDGLYLVPTVIE